MINTHLGREVRSHLVCPSTVMAIMIAMGNVGQVLGQAALPSFGNITSVNAADSADTGDETNPRLAGAGTGNLVVVAQTDDPAGGVGTDLDLAVSFSSDGGATWSEPQPLNSDATTDSADDMNPDLATDTGGTWVTVWQAAGTGSTTTTDIRWSVSSDNGVTWSDPAPLTHAVENVNPAATDADPQLATDGAGTWIIVWTSSRDIDGNSDDEAPLVSADDDILFSVSTNNAESFGPAQALNADHVEDETSDTNPSIATDTAGNWMVVWESAGQIVFSRSENNGTTWTPPLPVEGATGTDPVLHNDGAREATGTTAWYCLGQGPGISVSRYLESDTPEEQQDLLPDGEVFDEWLPPIAVAASGTDASIANDSVGRLIVAWEDGDILASLSINVGREWSAPATVDPDGDSAGASPQAIPVGSDSWVILWSSAKDRSGSGTDADLVVSPFTFGVFADCNANGVDDSDDIAAGTSEDCNTNGIPDECRALEADNDGDGTIDACDDTPFGDNSGGENSGNDGGGDAGDGGSAGGSSGGTSAGSGTGGGGGFSFFPCAFGIVGGLIPILLGLSLMKIGRRRRYSRRG